MVLDDTFINALASAAPTPGGGGASAYCGMLAAALSSMVGELTVGKPKYAAVEPEIHAVLEDLAERRARLERLVDADAQAFAPLAASYRMPRDTPELRSARHTVQQEALADACAVPLEIMEQCAGVIDDCAVMAQEGNRAALSDAGASAVIAQAALQAASLNIFVNAASMEDAQKAEDFRSRARTLIDAYAEKSQNIYNQISKEIGA
jgi:formiminotetrahydrofolate cyclodeaminase